MRRQIITATHPHLLHLTPGRVDSAGLMVRSVEDLQQLICLKTKQAIKPKKKKKKSKLNSKSKSISKEAPCLVMK